MKVLQIIPSVSLVYGGPSQMVRSLSKALAKQGVDVTILTTNSNGDVGQPPLDVPLNQGVREDGYQVFYFPCSPFRRYKFSLGLLQWLNKHGREYDLAHIHALFSPVSTAAATVARGIKLPYILRPLGTLDPADLRKKKYLKKIYGVLWEKPNLAGAGGLHFTSDRESEISYRFGVKTRDFVLPLGVELPPLPPQGQGRQVWGIAKDIPLLLFMSRLDKKKGLDLLIPALAQLQREGVPFHFVLAGANPQDHEYENQIKQEIINSGLIKQTTITGFVEGEAKLGLLRDADLFVLPSYYENFGIAVAEAMLAGVPVLISDQVYIDGEVKGADAGWISQCNLEDLTVKLRIALQDREELRRRGELAKKLAREKYSWEAIAQATQEVYQRIIQPLF